MKPKFILLDNSLKELGGHNYEYAVRVLSSAERFGLEPILVSNKKFACKDFLYKTYPLYRFQERFFLRNLIQNPQSYLFSFLVHILKSFIKFSLKKVDSFIRTFLFLRDTRDFFHRIKLEQEDVVFIPNATLWTLKGMNRFFQVHKKKVKGSWHILFRWDFPKNQREIRELKKQLRLLKESSFIERVHFYTDTIELAQRYYLETAVPFEVLPIPIHPIDEQRGECEKESPLRISYIGSAREDKGFHLLHEVISSLQLRASSEKFLFTLQCYALDPIISPKIQRTLSAIKEGTQNQSMTIVLKEEALSSLDYQKLIAESDIVLIPYNPTIYSHRSSGILIDAMAQGKPVLVPDCSWMSNELDRYFQKNRLVKGLGLQNFVFQYPSVTECVSKLVSIAEYINEARSLFKDFSWDVREKNNPDALLGQLMHNHNICKY